MLCNVFGRAVGFQHNTALGAGWHNCDKGRVSAKCTTVEGSRAVAVDMGWIVTLKIMFSADVVGDI